MTALGDALAAAQSRAVAALGKQYVGGQMDGDTLRLALDSIGCTDPADTEQWIAALDVIRETGASLPTVNGAKRDDDPATDAQWKLIRRLCDERQLAAPNVTLTKAQASELIERIKAGTYTPDDLVVPF